MRLCLQSSSQAASRRNHRWRALPVVCLLVLPCALAASCASHPSKRTTKFSEQPAIVPATVETRVGVVRALGAEGRFVLIETPSALATSALSEGQLLHCRPPDALDRTTTADLRVSRERHQALIVANVVAGEPAPGAIVYAIPGVATPSTPAPGSISSVSTAPLSGLFSPPKP